MQVIALPSYVILFSDFLSLSRVKIRRLPEVGHENEKLEGFSLLGPRSSYRMQQPELLLLLESTLILLLFWNFYTGFQLNSELNLKYYFLSSIVYKVLPHNITCLWLSCIILFDPFVLPTLDYCLCLYVISLGGRGPLHVRDHHFGTHYHFL